MFKTFKVITDSTSDLTYEIMNKFDIDVINFKYFIDNECFEDPSDENRTKKMEEFYEKIKMGKKIKTSQINPDEFSTVFRKYLENGLDILFISFSSKMSGSYSSAIIAANELKEEFNGRKIVIFDSFCASLGEVMLVIEACKKSEEGYDLKDTVPYLENLKSHIKTIALIDDLSHLKESGRLAASEAFFGGLLGIKPILHFDKEGKFSLISKARGRTKAMNFLIESIKENALNIHEQPLYISHNSDDQEILNFENKLKSECNVLEIIKTKIGATLTAHVGLKVIAVFFKGKN